MTDKVVASPMKRCIQTAEIIYGTDYEVFDDLRECGFGVFENKSYEELKNDENYKLWLESGGIIPPPEGEGKREFSERCCVCFEKIIFGADCESIAFVVHGGTIMAILERFYYKKSSFYDWQIKNGEYLEFEIVKTDEGIKLCKLGGV